MSAATLTPRRKFLDAFMIEGIFVFIIWLILAFVLASAAKKRGRSYGAYLAIGLLLSPLLGVIILLLAGENKDEIAKRNISSGVSKKCPFCANEIKKEATVCQFCGRDLPKEESKETPSIGQNTAVIKCTAIGGQANHTSYVEKSLKGIVIAIGAIASFLLMRFLRIDHSIGQYFSGWIFANSIIAICAFIFGSIVAGAIGLFSTFIFEISNIFYIHGLYPDTFLFNLTTILLTIVNTLLYGLYGFILGKIFENKVKNVDEKNIIPNFGIFIISSVLLIFLISILQYLPIYFRFLDGYKSSGIGLSGFLKPIIKSTLISSLLVGIIGLLVIIIYLKVFKGNIPYFANKKENKPIEKQEDVS